MSKKLLVSTLFTTIMAIGYLANLFTFGVFALLVGLLGSYQRDQK